MAVRIANHWKVLLGLSLVLQFGCNFINRSIVYEDARETPPLAVPPDLLTPAVNPALQVPAVAGSAANVAVTPPTLGNTLAAARGGFPRAANDVLGLNDDEAASAWKRVGIALERSGCCRVLSKNEAALSYQVELASAAPRPGFFKRLFTSDSPSAMTVQVAAADKGSTVKIIGEAGDVRRDDAAMTVLGAVEARVR